MDANGLPLAGATLTFYEAGTSTPIATYQDAGATTPHASPVVADSAGTFPAIFVGTDEYKFILKTGAGVTVATVDHIPPPGLDSVSYGEDQDLTDEQKQRARSNIAAGIDVKQIFRWLASRFVGYETRLQSLERSRQ